MGQATALFTVLFDYILYNHVVATFLYIHIYPNTKETVHVSFFGITIVVLVINV